MNEEDREQYQKYEDKLCNAYIAYIIGLERALDDAKRDGWKPDEKYKLEERRDAISEIDNKLNEILMKYCCPPWKAQEEWIKYLQQSDQQVPSTP